MPRKLDQHYDSLSLAADSTIESIQVRGLKEGSLQISWTALDSLTSTFVVEGSNDDINWNELADPLTTTNPTGTQIYHFTSFGTRYIRVVHKNFGATAGVATITFEAQR